MMLRGPNLVLRKQSKALFSTYFGKKGHFSKILLRSLCSARLFKKNFIRKMAVNVPCMAHFEPVNTSKASSLVTVISQSFYMLILGES